MITLVLCFVFISSILLFVYTISLCFWFLFIVLYSLSTNFLVSRFYREWTEEPENRLDYISTDEERYSTYPQHYDIKWDLLVPLTMILMPFSVLGISFNFLYFAITYLVILVPFMVFWSNVRNWQAFEIVTKFYEPIILRLITTGLVYPSVYIITLGILRFFAMGRTFIPTYNFLSLEGIIYTIFLLPHIILSFYFIFKNYLKIRLFFLKEFKMCFHSLNVYFLRNICYWKFSKTVFKYDFFFHHLFSVYSHLNKPLKTKYPFIMKIGEYIWHTNPKIIYLLIPIFFICELYLKGEIYYWFYFLFAFFCLRIIFLVIRKLPRDTDNVYFSRNLHDDCDYSNYFNEKSWYTPYYPKTFAFTLEECSYGRYIEPSKIQRVKENAKNTRDVPFVNYYKKTGKNITKVLNASKLPFFRQVKLYYQESYGEKWLHTSSYVKPLVYNNMTKRTVNTISSPTKTHHQILPYLLQDVFSKLAMITEAHNWRLMYPKIQQAERLYLSPQLKKPLYSSEIPDSISQYSANTTTIKDLSEYNTLTAFSSWVKKGVEVSPHKDSNLYENNISQKNPDVAFEIPQIFSNNKPLLIGLDLKATREGRLGIASNNIVGISKEDYVNLLSKFERQFKTKLSHEARTFLKNLGDMDDVEERLIFYRDNMHYFAELREFPPINIEKMVFEKYFSSEYKQISFAHKIKLQQLSDYCFQKEPLKGNSIRQQTLDLLNEPNVVAIKKDIGDMLP